jgi:hypothetical protein
MCLRQGANSHWRCYSRYEVLLFGHNLRFQSSSAQQTTPVGSSIALRGKIAQPARQGQVR